jgi:hypothetical protein
MNLCEVKLRNQLLLLECEKRRYRNDSKMKNRLEYQIWLTEEKIKEVEDGDW